MSNALTEKIRAKYPGVYDDIPDAELTQKILAKYPDYADLAKQPGTTAIASPTPSQRFSEVTTGFQHPVEQLKSEYRQFRDDPIGATGRALKQAGKSLAIDLPNAILRHPIDTALNLTGGRQFSEDVSKGNYKNAAADVAGGITNTLGPLLVGGAKGRIAAGDAAANALSKAGQATSVAKDIGKAGLRKIGNPYGLASTGEELLTQGISPYAKATGFKKALDRAGTDIKAFDAQNPIKGVQDLNDAIPEIKQKIWSEEVEPALVRHGNKPVSMKPVADAVRKEITPEMLEFDEGNATKLEELAVKLENARDVTSANRLLKYVNGQLESYFAKYPSARRANLMANPETAGWEAARSSLREQFLGTLEGAGETGVRNARMRYGALEEIGKQVERRVNVADRAKPMSINRILGMAGAIPTAGASVLAGELGHYLNKPDVLIRRGIAKLPDAAKEIVYNMKPIEKASFAKLMAPKSSDKPIKPGIWARLADMFGSEKELQRLLDLASEDVKDLEGFSTERRRPSTKTYTGPERRGR